MVGDEYVLLTSCCRNDNSPRRSQPPRPATQHSPFHKSKQEYTCHYSQNSDWNASFFEASLLEYTLKKIRQFTKPTTSARLHYTKVMDAAAACGTACRMGSKRGFT